MLEQSKLQSEWIFVGNISRTLEDLDVVQALHEFGLYVGSITRFRKQKYAFAKVLGDIRFGSHDSSFGTLRIAKYVTKQSQSQQDVLSADYKQMQNQIMQLSTQVNELREQLASFSMVQSSLSDFRVKFTGFVDSVQDEFLHFRDSFKLLLSEIKVTNESVQETSIKVEEFEGSQVLRTSNQTQALKQDLNNFISTLHSDLSIWKQDSLNVKQLAVPEYVTNSSHLPTQTIRHKIFRLFHRRNFVPHRTLHIDVILTSNFPIVLQRSKI
eukprot:TRINITY_DN1452_c0_g1_i8.p2 TRINITY_DN1452_c0_g1~~TRINITY_DN1452_c0_g1_i8.p2  ORF type:complete len:269 (-),score=-1.00 TRINITY_DN1452_c0_g1_i8:294-1100(-)